MREGYIPASIRPCLEFDSCLEHVNYNIEKLPEMLTNEGDVGHFEVLDCIGSIITNVCRLVDERAVYRNANDTFCISTRLNSCHQEDMGKLKSELESIKGNDIYQKLSYARDKTVAHTNILYRGHRDTQKLLLETAEYLIEREDRLKKLMVIIASLVHDVEISIKKRKGEPLNSFTFTIKISVNPYTVQVEVP